MRTPALAGLCAALATGCASSPPTRVGGETPVWRGFRVAGITVTASAPKSEIERNWVDRMLVLGARESGLFSGVVRVPDEAEKADLLIRADVARVKRNNSYVKLYVDVSFTDGRTAEPLGKTQTLARSDIGARDMRDHHKAAGQAGKDIARQVLAYIQAQRARRQK